MVGEFIDKRIDPEYDTQFRCDRFREKLKELNELYQELLKYNIVGDFYIGPNYTYTHLPDLARFSVTTKKTY